MTPHSLSSNSSPYTNYHHSVPTSRVLRTPEEANETKQAPGSMKKTQSKRWVSSTASGLERATLLGKEPAGPLPSPAVKCSLSSLQGVLTPDRSPGPFGKKG